MYQSSKKLEEEWKMTSISCFFLNMVQDYATKICHLNGPKLTGFSWSGSESIMYVNANKFMLL